MSSMMNRAPIGALADCVRRWSAAGSCWRQKPSDTLPPGKNPHLGNKASIRSGLALYRVRCGDCHGLDASGYRGPDLTAVLGGMPDERLFQTIRKGVPGTEMPPSTVPDDDVLMIIAYLRNLNAAWRRPRSRSATSTTARGCSRRSVRAAIASATAAAGSGPTCRASAPRDRGPRWSAKSARRPSGCRPASRPVTLVTKDGQKIRGDQEERRRVLDSGDGHARAHPGVSQDRACRT